MPPAKDSAPRIAAMLLLALAATGCSVVPRTRLEDCRKRTQGLSAENLQLKDSVLSLRGQNRDLEGRAVEDARRIGALEETNQRLEQSLAAYQDEARQAAALLDQIRVQVGSAGGRVATAPGQEAR